MLTGKNILITGASSGIGSEIALVLSRKKANLVLLARNEDRLKQVFVNLSNPGNSKCILCDLTNEQDMKTMIPDVPKLDGVVFCAGVNEFVPIKFITQEKIDKIFDINYFSVILLIQKLLKNKLLNKGASIVFISSISSKMGVPATAIYAASKAAINSTVRVLAVELAPQHIRANAICPGIIKTPMIENTNIEVSQFLEQEKDYPLGFGLPADVANAVAFHLSDESRWLTGNIMILDGGLTLK